MLSQQALQISGVVFGARYENEPLENTFGAFKVIPCCQGSSGSHFSWQCHNAQHCGDIVVFAVRIPKKQHHAPKWDIQRMGEKHWPGPSKFSCFWWSGLFL